MTKTFLFIFSSKIYWSHLFGWYTIINRQYSFLSMCEIMDVIPVGEKIFLYSHTHGEKQIDNGSMLYVHMCPNGASCRSNTPNLKP
jgi:hypothetical protein